VKRAGNGEHPAPPSVRSVAAALLAEWHRLP